MNQSEAFHFSISCEFFLLGGGRENTNKKTRTNSEEWKFKEKSFLFHKSNINF